MTRLVVLGASNVRRGLPTVVQTARAAWGPDLEIFGAFGHGRSYGARSRFLIRDLPGIVGCGIWDALAAGSGPVSAVVTDVGNDVLYGAPVAAILGWVGECLSRLAAAGANIRLTALPLVRVRRVSAADFLLFRTLFFPGSRARWREAAAAIEALDSGLRSLAGQRGVTLVEPDPIWYGVDPIHIRRSRRRAAWAAIFGTAPAPAPMPASDALRLRAGAPDRRWIAGIERRAAQPSVRLGATRVSLY